MINIVPENKSECCGCNACAMGCPQKCITMVEDGEGFLYPKVNMNNCVNCNLCEKVCPIIQRPSFSEKKDKNVCLRTVGGWHKDEKVRYDSSSGGAFTLFAEWVLNSNGVVYGCTLKDDFKAEHVGIEKIEDLPKLRGSKYVQSDTVSAYREIKTHLTNERLVLFVGTPCQCAGLHSFLRKDYSNLYVCDFICHGVPSPKIFKSYIQHLEDKYQDKVVGFRFRNKDKGWKQIGQMGTSINFLNKGVKRLVPSYRDSYMNGFSDDLYLRPSCYDCQFKCMPKYYADFTIADFWGVKKVDEELYDGKGTSLIFIHTKRGEELFQKLEENFFYKEVDYTVAVSRNPSMIRSVLKNPRREKFFDDYAHKPFGEVERKYMNAFTWALHKSMKIGWNCIEKMVRIVMSVFLRMFHKTWDESQWNGFMQFIKFAMVGVSNVLVSYFINVTMLLCLIRVNLTYDYVIGNITGFALSVLWSFYWNNRFVFQAKHEKKSECFAVLLRTYISYGFTGIILNNILATLWIEVLGISKYISPLLNLPISVPINFFMQKLWVYKEKK